jgi:hypothetical protein
LEIFLNSFMLMVKVVGAEEEDFPDSLDSLHLKPVRVVKDPPRHDEIILSVSEMKCAF